MTLEPSNEYQKLVEARRICAEARPDYAAGFLSGEYDHTSTEMRAVLIALSALKLPHAGEIDSFKKPYAGAGHDIVSVFAAPAYRCARCGAHQIDLSEDLAYGEMRKCVPHAGDD